MRSDDACPQATNSSAPDPTLRSRPSRAGQEIIASILARNLEDRQRGWSLDSDGVYGPASRTVCTSLQRQERLNTDGIVGPKTWEITFAG